MMSDVRAVFIAPPASAKRFNVAVQLAALGTTSVHGHAQMGTRVHRFMVRMGLTVAEVIGEPIVTPAGVLSA
jgi:hypothetical protein